MFILFEGIDGVGKTTLATWLKSVIKDSVYVHEPGGTKVANMIARVFNSVSPDEVQPLTNLLLVSASRVETTVNVVKPALDRQQVVIADRYTPSTIAYQAFGLSVPMITVLDTIRMSTGGLEPDLVFYLRVDPVDTDRIKERADKSDKRSEYDDNFMRRVISGYEKLFNNIGFYGFRSAVVQLDAFDTLDNLKEQILSTLRLYKIVE